MCAQRSAAVAAAHSAPDPFHTPSASSSSGREVLSIGQDPALLERREPVLRSFGCRVRCCSPADAVGLIRNHTYDIGIFCHTLSREQAVRLACTMHRHSPTTKLLLLIANRPRGFEGMLFDDAVETVEGPEALLTHVGRLLNRR